MQHEAAARLDAYNAAQKPKRQAASVSFVQERVTNSFDSLSVFNARSVAGPS